MTSSNDHQEAKALLSEISTYLQDETIPAEQRKELEFHASALAGSLLRNWFPVSNGRRLIMLGIVLLGIYEMFGNNYQPLVYWLILPFFSPRIVGEVIHAWARLINIFSHGLHGRMRR
jgi:hypothetical protein